MSWEGWGGMDTLQGSCDARADGTPSRSGHLSTIYCTLADFSYDSCTYSRRLLRVPDGGSIALDFTPPITPEDPIDSRPILVVLHGLTGGSHESYVIDILGKVSKQKDPENPDGFGLGWRGCVVNFRGCAGTPVTSKQLYQFVCFRFCRQHTYPLKFFCSGGYTDDLRCALAFLSHLAPQAPLYGIGFSLGANVLAKYLGEEGEKTPLKCGLILGAPWNFYECVQPQALPFAGSAYAPCLQRTRVPQQQLDEARIQSGNGWEPQVSHHRLAL